MWQRIRREEGRRGEMWQRMRRVMWKIREKCSLVFSVRALSILSLFKHSTDLLHCVCCSLVYIFWELVGLLKKESFCILVNTPQNSGKFFLVVYMLLLRSTPTFPRHSRSISWSQFRGPDHPAKIYGPHIHPPSTALPNREAQLGVAKYVPRDYK